MTVKKLSNGNYQARVQFDGKRHSKNFPSSREAKAWEATILKSLAAGQSPISQKDNRRLPELIELWYKLHGKTLKDGKKRKQKLLYMSEIMGDPKGRAMNSRQFIEYRNNRLETGSTENTCNHDLAYIKALFNELIRQEEWRLPNPVENVRKLKFDEKEMHFLNKAEIERLLQVCEESKSTCLTQVVELCLRTGARWGEANQLTASDIKIEQKRAWIVFEGTKSGKVRRVPINTTFARQLRGNQIGSARLFQDCLSAFRRALGKAKIELPAGQATHVLRHSFASHYMMNGGDILKLQKLLGHSTVLMTMRYAHLAPEALDDVLDKHALK